jgi:deazaflavin-dependent oxidoreductase (nitroreductase family)
MSEKTEKEESQAGKSMPMPTDMKAFNAKVIADFRASHGKFTGPMAGRGVLILTTTGARSGKERTAVLGYGRDGERLVVIASDNGAPAAPAWYHNLLARPIATVELGPEPFEVRARTARADERDELAKAVPYLEQQQSFDRARDPDRRPRPNLASKPWFASSRCSRARSAGGGAPSAGCRAGPGSRGTAYLRFRL